MDIRMCSTDQIDAAESSLGQWRLTLSETWNTNWDMIKSDNTNMYFILSFIVYIMFKPRYIHTYLWRSKAIMHPQNEPTGFLTMVYFQNSLAFLKFVLIHLFTSEKANKITDDMIKYSSQLPVKWTRSGSIWFHRLVISAMWYRG